MSDKDIIIRISGTNVDASEFLKQVATEAQQIGLIPVQQSIRAVPDKVRKKDLQNKKAKDVKISVQGEEGRIELFIESVIEAVSEETMLSQPSVNLKIEKHKND